MWWIEYVGCAGDSWLYDDYFPYIITKLKSRGTLYREISAFVVYNGLADCYCQSKNEQNCRWFIDDRQYKKFGQYQTVTELAIYLQQLH